jgi:hypothetical protein
MKGKTPKIKYKYMCVRNWVDIIRHRGEELKFHSEHPSYDYKVQINIIDKQKQLRFGWLRVFSNLRFTSNRVSLKKNYKNNQHKQIDSMSDSNT